MQVYHGKSVFGGIAMGKISVFSKKEHKIVRVKIDDTYVELARFEEARQTGAHTALQPFMIRPARR